jgi:20S proteasome alpha/beta subunit
MLSKCANPNCPTRFRYLHEGRLYVIDPRGALARHKPRCSSASGQLVYAWLCSSCSIYLTIEIDEEFGTRVVGKVEAKNGFKFSTSTNETNEMEIT